MFKKELREIWKPALFRLCLVLAIPFIVLALIARNTPDSLSRALYLLLISFPVALVWISNFLGVTAFKAEYEDRALEYWLTFPHGISPRLARKLAARIALVLLLVLFYAVLRIFRENRISDALNLSIVGPCSVLFFINGCLCGFLSDRNLRMTANVVTFLSIVVLSLGLSRILYPIFSEGNQAALILVSISSFLLVIVIMGGIFCASARKFDLRSPERFLKRTRVFGLPLILALDIAALIIQFAGGRS